MAPVCASLLQSRNGSSRMRYVAARPGSADRTVSAVIACRATKERSWSDSATVGIARLGEEADDLVAAEAGFHHHRDQLRTVRVECQDPIRHDQWLMEGKTRIPSDGPGDVKETVAGSSFQSRTSSRRPLRRSSTAIPRLTSAAVPTA